MTSQTYSPYASARGTAVYSQPASPGRMALAALFDLGFIVSVEFVAATALGVSPVLSASKLSLLALLSLGYWAIFRAAFGATLGQKLWDLKPDRTRIRWGVIPGLLQRDTITSATLGFGSFLTLSIFAITAVTGYEVIAHHPLGAQAVSDHWDAFLPPLSATDEVTDTTAPAPGSELWGVYPFFYSLGAWPKTFRGKDVFYFLPYEKGPPERFIGRIEARWSTPDTKVWFEGPKTPLAQDRYPFDRAEIRRCVSGMWGLPIPALFHCLAVRDALLSRHFDSFKQGKLKNVSLRWMEVSNPALPAQEQTQGIYLSASSESRGQDRFILITNGGTNQTFVLNYPLGPDGQYAQEVFQKAIRSLRVSDDLNPGRAWVDQGIEKVKLQELDSTKDEAVFARKVAAIQALLISRTSVEPKTYETYYHLAGTSLMLARRAAKLKLLPQGDALQATGVDELSVAKPLIQNAYRYAQDVGPADKRNSALQSFWFEAEKL
jgi:hypothetical protein